MAVIDKEGEVVCIIGVRSITNTIGQVWLLASPRIEKLSIPFLRNSRIVTELFTKDHKLLFNYVDARNKLHIKWLKWCGFTFINKHEKFGFVLHAEDEKTLLLKKYWQIPLEQIKNSVVLERY